MQPRRTAVSGGSSLEYGFAWRAGVQLDCPLLEVAEGLERAASRMLIKDGLPDAATEQPGLLRLARSVPADRLSPLPRYVYSVRLPMAEARSPTNASDLIDSMLGDAGERPYWRTHLDWDEAAPAPYRFSLKAARPRAMSIRLGFAACASVWRRSGPSTCRRHMSSRSSFLGEAINPDYFSGPRRAATHGSDIAYATSVRA